MTVDAVPQAGVTALMLVQIQKTEACPGPWYGRLDSIAQGIRCVRSELRAPCSGQRALAPPNTTVALALPWPVALPVHCLVRCPLCCMG